MSSILSRRRFLQVSGLTAGTAAAGLTALGTSANAAPSLSPRLRGRGLVAVDSAITLLPSKEGQPNAEFVARCTELMDRKTAAGEHASLESVVVRLCSDERVRLSNVADADAWLSRGGYYASLKHFTELGGRNVIIFPELNVIGDPHFSTDPRAMAYLAVALRRAFWSGGHRGLYTFFPGPAGTEQISSGTWHSGLAEYFGKYDLRGRDGKARTFGETYRDRVDAAIARQTLLHHAGMGVFDGLALADSGKALDREVRWLRDHLGGAGPLLLVEPSRETESRRVARSEMLVTVAKSPLRTGIQTASPGSVQTA